jgi:hypothetical protein
LGKILRLIIRSCAFEIRSNMNENIVMKFCTFLKVLVGPMLEARTAAAARVTAPKSPSFFPSECGRLTALLHPLQRLDHEQTQAIVDDLLERLAQVDARVHRLRAVPRAVLEL